MTILMILKGITLRNFYDRTHTRIIPDVLVKGNDTVVFEFLSDTSVGSQSKPVFTINDSDGVSICSQFQGSH